MKPGRQPFISLTPVSLLALAGLIVLGTQFALASSSPALDARAEQEQTLQPRVAVQCHINAGAVRNFRLNVGAGQFVKILIEQQGIDIVAMLRDPDMANVFEADSPYSDYDLETIILVTAKSGDYHLELKPREQKATGNVTIRVADLHPATGGDRTIAEAEQAYAQGQLTRFTRNLDDIDRSVPFFKRAVDLWHEAGDLRGEAKGLHRLGHVSRILGRNTEAISYCEQALAKARAAGDTLIEGRALYTLATIYNNQNEFDKALAYYLQALQIRIAINDPETAFPLVYLGQIYYEAGEHQKSSEYFNQALEWLQRFPDKYAESIVFHEVGLNYYERYDNLRALEYLQRSLQLRRDLKDSLDEGRTLFLIAMVLRKAGDTEKALKTLNRVLEIALSNNDKPTQGDAYTYLGFIYRELNENEKSLEFHQRALQLISEKAASRNSAQLHLSLGMLYSQMGRPTEAEQELRLGLRQYESIKDRSDSAVALYYLARAEQRQGKATAALADSDRALNLLDQLDSNLKNDSLRFAFLSGVRRYYELEIQLCMRLDRENPMAGYDARALETSERARARSLLSLLREIGSDITAGVDQQLLSRERLVSERLNIASARLTDMLGRADSPAEAAAMDRLINDLIAERDDIKAQIRERSPRYAALVQTHTASLSEMQHLLDNDTVLVEYALGDASSYAWVVKGNSVKSFALPPGKEIELAAKRVYELLKTQSQAVDGLSAREQEISRAVADLSKMILWPVAGELNKRRIAIVADGALQYIPFAALVLPQSAAATNPNEDSLRTLVQGNGKTTDTALIAKYELLSLPSASVLQRLREDFSGRPSAPKSVMVIADPVFDAADERVRPQSLSHAVNRSRSTAGKAPPEVFSRLPFARREAAAIQSLVAQGGARSLLDFAASRENVTGAELSQYRVIHFATHGLLDSEHPDLSGLVLSLVRPDGSRRDDGFLRLHDIYNMHLGAELVVLSACQTALGKEAGGDGLVGLTRGFMYAGSPRVIASLWKVDDAATAELMKQLYTAMLQGGLRPAAALRAAQLKMLASRRWNSPAYWAAFVLQGEWN